jgi:hypothetical protein
MKKGKQKIMNVLVIDTETANSVEQPLPYDVGYAIVDTETGEILTEKSFVVAEIFLDKELMKDAYFAEKIPMYWDDLKAGKRIMKSIFNIRKTIKSDMSLYNVSKVGAYNMGFDNRATRNDIRYLSGSLIKWFFPYGTEFFCIWHMACTSGLLNSANYVNYATTHGFVSDAGNIQTSAECAYRYLKNDPIFAESHTGLEDVKIEVEILMNCLKMANESMKCNPYSACWRNVQKIAKQIELNNTFAL